MASTTKTQQQVHFVLFPYMAQGHMIPMVDIAKLLASRPDVVVTIVTTPVNAARFKSPLDRAIDELRLPINVISLRLPCSEAGLPENCENVDLLPSITSLIDIYRAAALMEPQVETLFETLEPPPSCIISDFCLPYTNRIAKKFDVPRISFHGFSCFCLLCLRCVKLHGDEFEAMSKHEYFVLQGFPGGIEFTRAQLPMHCKNLASDSTKEGNLDDVSQAESDAYGFIVNTFEELEAEYLEELKVAKQGRVWCVGPVSLTNCFELDKLERGNSSVSSSSSCLRWLDDKEQNSVIYVCLGSICNLSSAQLMELALGLEASDKTFLWVVREIEKTKELFQWMEEEKFEERVSSKGMVIRGWAPQLMILCHRSIGGFMTHCGWNSSLEGISAGIPLVTWPLFGDQFCNEKLIVEVVKIGVKVGAWRPTYWNGNETEEVFVKREQVERAVRLVMDGGEEGEARRTRAKELAEMAKRAVGNGGSSHTNVTTLIEDIIKEQRKQ
ncbi:unnamed protein product [Linum tenue]|uniref:Glycosyltransferase n=2 Tax=Linum tenue TaxID=586396 RepID=A0AAV0JFR0_9ROSI|nr:unnamed protein product [Linum tenue]